APAAPVNLGELRGKRALLVDDNRTNLRILSLQTERWGMTQRASEDPSAALALVAAGEQFDVVITDMHMPQMDGAALARQLRALRPTLPLVLLSSVNIRQTPDAQLFSSVLTKPARQQALFDALVCAIPAARPAQRKADTKTSQFDATLGERMPLRILLAEDNEVNRKVALRMLKGFGYQADVAANGLEAVAAVRRQAYDVVLMDIQMPEMDGLEAARIIVSELPSADRPRIIAMSANAMREDTEAAVAAGMDDYVVKPISVPLLQAALEKCGELKAARRHDAPAAAAGVLDDSHLESFIDLDPSGEFLESLVASFEANSRRCLAELRQAVTDGDAAATEAVAHQLKGTSAALGVTEMSRLCIALEALAQQGRLQDAGAMVAACEREFAAGLQALNQFLTGHRTDRALDAPA
ncbi:MAG: multi-sensor hybrid histidine kinase, partial [Ramlibacter sp.]|nr:multi-sensor hybrid histidine kinase [Ramlibacter sp.]